MEGTATKRFIGSAVAVLLLAHTGFGASDFRQRLDEMVASVPVPDDKRPEDRRPDDNRPDERLVDNIGLSHLAGKGKLGVTRKLVEKWGFSQEIADCLASATSPVSTAIKSAFFVAAKGGTPNFIEVYDVDVEKLKQVLQSSPAGSVILALDYQWHSIETLSIIQKYADKLHSIILLWGVHNAIDQKDFTEAGEIYMQLYALVKCVNPSIFIWKQVCLVTAEDGIFRWLEAVDGPCDGFMVWGPYMLPGQIFATSSINRWWTVLGKDKPIALGSLFSYDAKQLEYARKAGYAGVIRQDATLPMQWVDSPKAVVLEPEPAKPEPSRWDN